MKHNMNTIIKTLGVALGVVVFALVALPRAEAAEPVVAVIPTNVEVTTGARVLSSVVLEAASSTVYAVEGTLVFTGLSCQSIMLGEGLIAQTTPTCVNPYFLVGIPSGTQTNKTILSVATQAGAPGEARLALVSVDIIGEGKSLGTAATAAVYTIAEAPVAPARVPAQPSTVKTPEEKVVPVVASEVSTEKTESTLLAAVINAARAGSWLITLGLFLGLLVLSYFFYQRKKGSE